MTASLFPELDLPYRLGWDGTLMQGTLEAPIAFDTETWACDEQGQKLDLRVGPPKMVLATVSDGVNHFVLHPSEIAEWIVAHRDQHIVGHNFSFDFWVVARELKSQEASSCGIAFDAPISLDIDVTKFEPDPSLALKIWWDMGDRGQFHDTMLLDLLITLAEGRGDDGSDKLEVRNLGLLAKQYCPKIVVNKEDPFRLRYHEIASIPFEDWGNIDPGFFAYAMDDAKATHAIWKKVYLRGVALHQKYLPPAGQKCYTIFPDSMERFGVLTEQIQVLGAIGLQSITHIGLHFSPERAKVLEEKTRKKVKKSLKWLKKRYPELFAVNNKGEAKFQPKSHLPSFSTMFLKGILQTLANVHGLEAPQSQGKLKGISASIKEWNDHLFVDPFFEHWTSVGENGKLLSFFDSLKNAKDDVIHPSYRVLVRTGRTSCSRPNAQQFPKDEEFRAMFTARPGYKIVAIDASAIELRTLATITRCKQGYSKMREIFALPTGQDDPHAFTASMMLKVSFEEFLTWKKSLDPEKQEKFKSTRQKSKVPNFGVPGGLSADKLVRYAKFSYGIDMTIEEADHFRKRLINEIYPELNESNGYLASFSIQDLSRNTGVTVSAITELLKAKFSKPHLLMILMERVCKGITETKSGRKFAPATIAKCWDVLEEIVEQSPIFPYEMVEKVKERKPSFKLATHLFGGIAATLTGRVRSRVGYTQKLNTPFQSLAADGAKLAIWRCVKEGFRVVSFEHDALVVEVPEATAEEDAKRIDHILCSEIERVLIRTGETVPVVPMKCEYRVADCWKK